MKGGHMDVCYRTDCNNSPATHYNSSTRKHYCVGCAREINYWSNLDHNVTLCKPVTNQNSHKDGESTTPGNNAGEANHSG